MLKISHNHSITTVLILVALITACSKPVTETATVTGAPMVTDNKTLASQLTQTQISDVIKNHKEPVVIAINLGGPAYTGVDGVEYQADSLDSSAAKGQSMHIMGSQDAPLFETFRRGNMQLSFAVDNGQYDIIFKFAEPDDIAGGERVFNVLAQGEMLLEAMDVRVARDGRKLSSVVKTSTNVTVTQGQLTIDLQAVAGEPVLHGLIVRRKHQDPRDWQMVWSDEFDYTGAPDNSKWTFDEWPAKKVNGEDQAYTARAKNARVEDGRLIIQAHKEQYGNAQYSSARLHSLGKGDFLYGKVEARVKLPAGQGNWSAIWMLPSDPFKYATTCKAGEDWQGSTTCDAWPNSGEIDILEHVGYDMQNVHGTVHTKAYYWVNWQQRKASIDGKTVDQNFHLYSLEWTPEHIIVSFDNTPYFFYKNEGTGWEAWPFDHPYHLILNLAIGGDWGRAGGPIDDSLFPMQMEIDYVRISQLKQP
jgi:beta-glucanase (GH16 family)